MGSTKKLSIILASLSLVAGLLAVPVAPVQAAAPKPSVSVGATLANGSPIQVELTSKYKNKVATVELGILVKRKLKYLALSTVTLSITGSVTLCSTSALPSGSVVRVKVAKKIIVTAKTSKRKAIPACPLAAPAALDLAASSDSGSSDSDNITNSTDLTVSGTAFPLSTIQLFDGQSAIQTNCSADAQGAFSCALPTNPTEGQHVYSTKATIDGVASPASSPLTVTVDRTKPTVSLGWEESEIGLYATVHLNVNASEAITGLALSDIYTPSGPNFSMIEFRNLTPTGDNYRITVLANEYNATDLVVFMDANSVTDLAGNAAAGTHTVQGVRKIISGYLPLDLYGPQMQSASAERLTTPVPYGKLTFALDEPALGATLNSFAVSHWTSSGKFEEVALGTLSTDGILHTTDHQHFWVFVSDFQAALILNPTDYGFYSALSLIGTVTDDYGNVGSFSDANMGPWPY